MKSAALFLAALFLVPTGASAGKHVKGPQGVLMGLLVDPPGVGQGVVVRCDDSQMRELSAKVSAWKTKVDRIQRDEAKVGETAARLAGVYSRYPVQAGYFGEMSSAVNGDNGLTAYLRSISSDLDRANRCMWDPRYLQAGCRYVPEDCLNEGNIEARISQSQKATQALIDNLNANSEKLMSGLPVQCTAQRQVCQQTMAHAIGRLNRAQEVIQGEY